MHNPVNVDRRSILQAAILLVGGSLAGGTLASCSRSDPTGRYFEPDIFKLLDSVCETVIPQTDTPGASAAGVPDFIDGMMRNWASQETRNSFERALNGINVRARETASKDFVALGADERENILSAYDAESSDDWRALKRLSLMGYYLSEEGATQELRYELVPGEWDPDVEVTPETRAWAV